jgi:hypothetical protein
LRSFDLTSFATLTAPAARPASDRRGIDDQEAIHHGGNGLLVDFFSPDAIAERVTEALEDRRSFASLRQNARQTILDRYDLRTVCLPAHLRLLNTLVPREHRMSVHSAVTTPLMKATG